ncbi:MAG: glycosyltransferase [Flavobacterium sp.]|uniref:glycosyltransferase family 2 protein n=1 Tax=Flavobacterium sp. TaxID=239 RepID=UPI0032635FA5
MKASFVCVNYNNSKVTQDYISNVLNIKNNHDVKIVVVDNASQNEDVNNLIDYIHKLNNEHVILIRSEVNLGYFKGLNLGIKWSIENQYNQYQIVGNNDLVFFSDFLDTLESIAIKKAEMVLAPDVITIDGIHENPHVINKMPFLRKFKYKIYYSNYYVAKLINNFYSTERKYKAFDPERKYIHMGIGALYVLTPNFFQHFNALWDHVFLYGEEAILAGQMDSVAGKIVYEPSLKCNHNESATTSKMESKYKYEVIQRSYRIYKKYL